MLIGMNYIVPEDKNDHCGTREAIEVTAHSFNQTLSDLESTINEGADHLKRLHSEEEQIKVLETIASDDYKYDEKGIYYNEYSKEKSTGFATGYVEIDSKLKNALMATESLDPYFKNFLSLYPFVTQIYYNDVRSFLRIYPSFSVPGVVEPNTDLTNYNFLSFAYDRGDEIIFINKPYIDPAGKGWVVSLVKPVRIEDDLIGVIGVDLSLEMLNDLLIVKNGMLIVNEVGDILTLSEDMYQQAGLKVLKEHRYYSQVDKTISLPEEYNLNKSKIKGFRDMWHQVIDEDQTRGEINYDGKERNYCAIPIEAYGIYLIHINVD